MARVSFNRNYNMNRVVKRLIATLLSLWVGGTIITEFGNVMKCSYSPFYKGLSLIGWTITDTLTVVNSTVPATCNTADSTLIAGTTYNSVITDTAASGVLAVVGIIGLASVVMEFVSFNL